MKEAGLTELESASFCLSGSAMVWQYLCPALCQGNFGLVGHLMGMKKVNIDSLTLIHSFTARKQQEKLDIVQNPRVTSNRDLFLFTTKC